jgi:uncharacterized protein (DUF2252 family)
MRRDPMRAIRDFNASRDPEMLRMKVRKMADSPFSLLRGACHLFYADLVARAALVKGPTTWICGDLHFENFGAYRGDNRLSYFDINDFDEALLAPAWWDVVRFLVSLLVGTKTLHIRRAQAQNLSHDFLTSYSATLASGKARWIERDTADGMIRDLLAGLRRRTRAQLLAEQTTKTAKGKRKLRLSKKRALKVSNADREKVEEAIIRFAESCNEPNFFRVRDVARRVAGTGSLGLERYVILVRGRSDSDGNFLLDLKHQPGSSVARAAKVRQPAWSSEAARVVQLTQHLQAIGPAFLNPLEIEDRSYTLREMMPQEDGLSIGQWQHEFERLKRVVEDMGTLVAWAHLRGASRHGAAGADELVSFGQQKDWHRPLTDYAQDYAQTVRRDWKLFRSARKDGYFEVQ